MSYQRLAMAIDCDGSLTAPNFNPQIQVVNTNQDLMFWLCENFGGSYYPDNGNMKKNPNAKLMFHWQPPAFSRQQILESIIPYLVLKKNQALICLELLKMVRKRGLSFTQPHTDREHLLRLRYKEMLHELNS